MLKQNSPFFQSSVKSLYHRNKGLSYLEPNVWGILTNRFKNTDRLDKFNKAIKNKNLIIDLVEFVRTSLKMSILYRKQCLNHLMSKQ